LKSILKKKGGYFMGLGNFLGSGNDMFIVLIVILLLFTGDSECFGSDNSIIIILIIFLLLFNNNGLSGRSC
jgi:hypothetical protein